MSDHVARYAADENSRQDRYIYAEQRLFQMVIVQAVEEALGHVAEDSRAIREARHWILSDTDFETTCDLAGWDAEAIRRRVLDFIREGKLSNLLDPLTRRPRRHYVREQRQSP